MPYFCNKLTNQNFSDSLGIPLSYKAADAQFLNAQ